MENLIIDAPFTRASKRVRTEELSAKEDLSIEELVELFSGFGLIILLLERFVSFDWRFSSGTRGFLDSAVL